MPHASDCTKMCIQSIESMGSSETACPSSILFIWCSCADTAVLKSSDAVKAAVLAVDPMLTMSGAESRQAPQVWTNFDGSDVEVSGGN